MDPGAALVISANEERRTHLQRRLVPERLGSGDVRHGRDAPLMVTAMPTASMPADKGFLPAHDPAHERSHGASGAGSAARKPPSRRTSPSAATHKPAGQQRETRYSMRRPLMARAMTSCWICSVPSKMSKILASRCQRSTGYSRV